MVIINTELLEYVDKLSKKKEKWKKIKIDGKKTDYSISNFGNIANNKLGKVYNLDNTDSNRYIRWAITINGKTTRFLVHRLVAMYFCEIPKRYKKKGLTFDDLVVNHKNGIKHCNASFNLEWVTTKENSDHAWKTGLCDEIRGEKAHLAKITEKEAVQICELIMKKKSNKEICEIMNVGNKTVQHIRSGECWKHIVSKYKFPKLGNSVPFKITDDTIHKICKLIEENKLTDTEIGNKFDVSRKMVNDIRLKKRRKKISQFYNF
jgi:hypothetical protein